MCIRDRVGGPGSKGHWKKHKSGLADVIEGRLAGERVVLGRSRSYMNESGGPVSSLATFFDVDPDHVIVIHDELDIDFGMLRLKLGGGDNGHNGLKSVIERLGTEDFARVRVGVGDTETGMSLREHVLEWL